MASNNQPLNGVPRQSQQRPSYKGEFSFVSGDPSRATVRHNPQVRSHIHGNYQRWVRLGGSDRIRKQTGVASAAERDGAVRYALQRRGWTADDETDSARTTSTDRSTSSPTIKRESSSLSSSSAHSLVSAATHPLTILQKGNSDPFNATSISIDPLVNSILAFYRDSLLPAMYALEIKSAPSSQGLRNWRDSASALYDPCTAYSFLARSAVLMSASAPAASTLALRAAGWRERASVLLRARLAADADALDSDATHRAIFALLITELFAENLAAAAVHAKMLVGLLRRHAAPDLRFLYKLLYNDVQRSSMALTRPAFDLSTDGWIAQQFTPIWQRARADLPELSGLAASALDVSIDDPALRGIFVWHRELSETLALVTRTPSIVSPLTWPFLTSRASIGQGRLVEHYLDMVALAQRMEEAEEVRARDRMLGMWRAWTGAYAALAALYWTRAVSKIEEIPVGPVTATSGSGGPGSVATIYRAAPTILEHMKAALVKSQDLSLYLDARLYAPLRLWALYIGAIAEQGQTDGRLDAAAKGAWFNARFAEQARDMGLMLWPAVRAVLAAFLYTDHMQPHGALWFWKIMDNG